ncbi:helix-turn-helix domain-containing protein [Aliifodinibius salicampi]|uniref:Helix-turn-helix domain-containing protein n=1 Tax=Fodinibius salicampi TaxID=1920655 RepID=A0ABT3PZE4_9BACT|nr:helix-turn-helix domain-containing protein [Fodinibius salicampi]MCW9713243.1 helix-turn-helix domain-containing protein [Fodinibius salicampi]
MDISDSKMMTLHIKNMVCPRCLMVVRQTLEELGFEVLEVELGQALVQIDESISMDRVEEELKKYGFELIRDRNQQLIEQIKTLLIRYIQESEQSEESPKLSDYLAKELHQNYSSLSSAFSESQDTTIEKYLIHLKIERVKELLSYGEMTLSEIAYRLNYSSVAYLSNQFKKITGMSVTDYKKARDSFRKPLDGIEGQ